jgi:hypothetical protein
VNEANIATTPMMVVVKAICEKYVVIALLLGLVLNCPDCFLSGQTILSRRRASFLKCIKIIYLNKIIMFFTMDNKL